MTIIKGNIGNALHSVAPDHIVATADEIFDEALGQYQNEINQSAGAFDISEYNKSGDTPATYATLALALAAVPSAQQKGGMTIKYIDSTTSKYVQYRLTATAWSTTEADWQGVDAEPVNRSGNLIESAAVFKIEDKLTFEQTYNILDTAPLKNAADITYSGGEFSGTLTSFNGKSISLTCEQSTRYTLSLVARCEGNVSTSGDGLIVQFNYSDSSYTRVLLSNSASTDTALSLTSASYRTVVSISFAYSSSGGNIVHIKNLQVVKGTSILDYIPHLSVKDINARIKIEQYYNRLHSFDVDGYGDIIPASRIGKYATYSGGVFTISGSTSSTSSYSCSDYIPLYLIADYKTNGITIRNARNREASNMFSYYLCDADYNVVAYPSSETGTHTADKYIAPANIPATAEYILINGAGTLSVTSIDDIVTESVVQKMNSIGKLSDLSTSNKQNIVAAINEIDSDISTINDTIDGVHNTVIPLENYGKYITYEEGTLYYRGSYNADSSYSCSNAIPLSQIRNISTQGIKINSAKRRLSSSMYSYYLLDANNSVVAYPSSETGSGEISHQIAPADIPATAEYILVNGGGISFTTTIDNYSNVLGLSDRVAALENTSTILSYYNKAAICLVDDDFASVSKPTKVKQICDSLGVKCTFAPMPDENGEFSEAKTTAMQQFQAAGFQFALHPKHSTWASGTASIDVLAELIIANKLALKTRNLYFTEDVIILPGGQRTDNVMRITPQYFNCLVGASGGSYNNAVEHDLMHIQRVFIKPSELSVSATKAIIDEAVSKGAWLVLGSHSAQFNDVADADNTETSDSWTNYAEILTYANSKCRLTTFEACYTARKPMFELLCATGK